MQKVYSFTDSELTCNILHMCPLKWQDQYHLLEKCYPEGVKPLLLILERIEVAHPVHEASAAAKPSKSQGSEQPSKKFTQGARIPRKPKHGHSENACIEKIATYARSMGAHTPRIIPQSAAVKRRTELLCEELPPIKEKIPGMTGIPRSPSHMYLHAWKT